MSSVRKSLAVITGNNSTACWFDSHPPKIQFGILDDLYSFVLSWLSFHIIIISREAGKVGSEMLKCWEIFPGQKFYKGGQTILKMNYSHLLKAAETIPGLGKS